MKEKPFHCTRPMLGTVETVAGLTKTLYGRRYCLNFTGSRRSVMLSALALWVVFAIMDLLIPLPPGRGLSDPGRRPKSLDHQRVA